MGTKRKQLILRTQRGILLTAFFLILTSNIAYALRNPAAVYCTALGYTYSAETTAQGQQGICRLPDGSSVGGWQFLQGYVARDYSYCSKMGYELKVIEDRAKCEIFGLPNCAVCVLPDSTEVEVTQLMGLNFKETTCGDGVCGIPENFATCPQDCPSGGYDGYCDGIADGICDPDCLNGEDPDCIDSDGDGVPDYLDKCPKSNLELNITIDGCNSGVKNVQVNNGCTMNDLIFQCVNGAKNHGKFVSCVSDLTDSWKKAGLISGKEKGTIQSCVAKANIP
jgi:putative hemolysin